MPIEFTAFAEELERERRGMYRTFRRWVAQHAIEMIRVLWRITPRRTRFLVANWQSRERRNSRLFRAGTNSFTRTQRWARQFARKQGALPGRLTIFNNVNYARYINRRYSLIRRASREANTRLRARSRQFR